LLCPDNLRVVMDRLLEMFRVWAPRAAEAGCDGVWGGEDVAGQEGLIMSPKVFREVLMPYYKELGDILHDSGLDYWWHSDGNITDILEDLVECGVDVVHPMQADCTDDAEVMSRYGGLVGGKVQFMCDPERGKISSMVHPILKNWDEFETLSFNHKCEWFKRYLNQLKIFVKGSSGKFGISHLILIDSLNFVFELFGATQTYVDLIEQPKMIEKATDFAFNLNLQVQRIFFQLVPLIDGGTCSELAEWLPGQIVSESVDPFHMTSVEYFEKWGRGPVERIFDQFDGGILHIHGNGRHLLNAVSTIRGLKAIYLGDDRGFPLAFDVLDNIKKQVGNIPLIVAVDFQKFINVLEKHQLRGGVLYRVSEVPCIDSANCCMEKVYSYKV
ncbi:MAG: hypothetical protein IMF11_17905, partial [Proteobacteria bacterium]|nr:hypothetical protein [Pseudomonadota bacterium]